MTSEERRAARRERRDARRAAKRAERNESATLEDVVDPNALYRAQREAARGVNWKASTQRYRLDWLLNNHRSRVAVLAGESICRGFHEFDIFERGKLRHIQSVHFSERVVQKALTQVAYVPTMSASLIYDNSANLKGRGTSFAVSRVKQAMARHWHRHGADGYVLQIDFTGYFASLPHDGIKDMVRSSVADPRVVALGESLVDSQGEVGLGLGSEPNQILAVGYPDPIDHAVRERCGVEYYGRYMDDIIVIDHDKAALQCVLAVVRDMAASMGLTVNERKTHIVKLSRGFTFLKVKYSYTETGRVLMRPCRESITRERRKLKKLARLVADGLMSYRQAVQSYQSWRGSKLRLDAHGAVLRMDKLFKELFADLRGQDVDRRQDAYRD